MLHLGDITKISGYEVPAVDVVIGGSPCPLPGNGPGTCLWASEIEPFCVAVTKKRFGGVG